MRFSEACHLGSHTCAGCDCTCHDTRLDAPPGPDDTDQSEAA